MRITNAVYQLSEIQRSGAEARTRSNRSRSYAPASPGDETPAAARAPKPSVASPEEILSLPEMLHEHFIEEVRRRDRDDDGRLSLHEFGGPREEFESLDKTGKGYVSARDLTREALTRNPELRDIVAGPWTPIYESLIRVRDPSDENLLQAVRDGAARSLESGVAVAPLPLTPGMQAASEIIPSLIASPKAEQVTAASMDFIMKNQGLRELHGRLQVLADRLGRFRQYSPIDLTG